MNELHPKSPSRWIELGNRVHTARPALIILGCSLLLTAGAWYIARDFASKRAKDRFEFRVKEITQAVADRMSIYEQCLWGAVGLFNASQYVDRGEFEEYVDSLNLDEQWPGIQGIGLSLPIAAEDKAQHIDEVRSSGFPDYTIRPEGDRTEYTSIIYLEPFDWRNQRAFGYDMWSNEMRRTAMKRARDTGNAATSGIITLVQETDSNVQRGFLTYLPVYKQGLPLETVEQRRHAFWGWVYSPFRAGDLMTGVLGAKDRTIEFEIYDGQQPNVESLLFDTNDQIESGADERAMLARTEHLVLQGRDWTVRFTASPEFFATADQSTPNWIAAAALLVDLLLFFVIYSLSTVQRRATQIAEQMTSELATQKEALLESNAELQRLSEVKTEFLANMSHELRTPMNSIIGFNRRLLKDLRGTISDREYEALEIVSRNAKQLLALINDVLDISKVEAGQMTLNPTSFQVSEAILATAKQLEPLADEKGIEVRIVLPEEIPEIDADFAKCTQVVSNIAANAVKFTSEGYVEIRLEFGEDPHIGKVASISIKDTGLGMSEEDRDRLFTRFTQLDSPTARLGTGSGLGLVIAKEYVLLHGGRITLESEPGRGTEFLIVLPLVAKSPMMVLE